ncbi:MAG: DUF4249 family protein [Bacteroidales bacterium]
MNLLKLSIYIIVIIPVFFLSCEKIVDWEVEGEQLNTIVVEGMLTNEMKHHEIKITRPKPVANADSEPVRDAVVMISTENASARFFHSEVSPGTYISEIPFSAGLNRSYELNIVIEGENYSAQSYMSPLFPYQTPVFNYHPQNGFYTIDWNNPQYDPTEQALYEAIIDWSHLTQNPNDSAKIRLLYYTMNSINVSHLLFPSDQERIFFPAGSIVIFSKYSVNEEYGNYLRALLSETQWQGSIFEPDRGNLPGNISNGGLGFFSVNAVSRDTLIVASQKNTTVNN